MEHYRGRIPHGTTAGTVASRPRGLAASRRRGVVEVWSVRQPDVGPVIVGEDRRALDRLASAAARTLEASEILPLC